MKNLFEKIPDKKSGANNITDSAPLKPSGRKPPAAGNRAFRMHNRLMFNRTSVRKEFGKANRI